MDRKLIHIAICLAAFAISAAAQTGTVPLDNGTPPTGLTNSNITEVNGNVGVMPAVRPLSTSAAARPSDAA